MSVEMPTSPGLQGRSLIAGAVAAEAGGVSFMPTIRATDVRLKRCFTLRRSPMSITR